MTIALYISVIKALGFGGDIMVAIIIGTHGKFSKEILRSAEMIFGSQENVAAVTFEPGENVEDLVSRYKSEMEELDCSDGVLFMVDLFGGSPFNAASNIVVSSEKNMDVVTGINMPMLLEVFSTRSSSTLEEILNTARKSGLQGIKSLKESLSKNIEEDDL